MQSDDPFSDLRALAYSELLRLADAHEDAGNKVAVLGPSNAQFYQERSVPRDIVLAGELRSIVYNDKSTLGRRIEDYDLTLSVQPTPEGQYFYNLVSSTNSLFLLGISEQQHFPTQLVSADDANKHDLSQSPRPKLFELFLMAFLKNIRNQICGSKDSSTGRTIKTGAVAGIASLIGTHLGVDPQLATGIAASVIIVVLNASRGAFCEMTDHQILTRLNFGDGSHDPPAPGQKS